MLKLLQGSRREERQGENDIVSEDLAADARRQEVPLPDLYGEGAQVAVKIGPTRLFGITIEEPGVVVISGSEIASGTVGEFEQDQEPAAANAGAD